MSSPSLIDENGTIRGVCPVDLAPLPPVASTRASDVQVAVQRARAAQPAWERLGLEARAALLKKACRAMLERRRDAVELIRMEAGKSATQAMMTEAIGPLEFLKNWVPVVRAFVAARKLPLSPVALPGKRGSVSMVPRGVVAIIAPWNYPVATYFKPLLPALLCGNTAVIKPSEYAPRSGQWVQSVLAESLPAGVVECVVGGAETGRALVDAGIDSIVFTGSPRTGREVLKAAAERLTPCNVELGGKDAAIVLEDCDFERTVAGIVQWGFQNAGQDCGAIERVYVVDAIADRFVEALAAAAARLTTSGEQYDVGPLCTPQQLAVVRAHVADARERGARVVTGGEPTGAGLSFQPTVLDACDRTMKVVEEETFGPVVPIIRVRDANDAVTQANDSRFGLNASIWSRDLPRAQELAERLTVGTVFINNHAITGALAYAPWTGVKESGYGIATGTHSLLYYVRPKTTVIDRGTKPDPWWLPMDRTMADVAERLALAQLGGISAALKLPLLFRRRVAAIRQLTRG